MNMKKRPMQTYAWVILALCVLLSFSYGFLVHRDELFPYSFLRWVAISAGFVNPPKNRLELHSRSKALALLAANPYVAATATLNPDKRGVLIHDAARAFQGYNFYNSWNRNQAWLIDMEGNVLHEWSYTDYSIKWHHVELLPNGDILVTVTNEGVIKLDKSSKLIWSHATRAHHTLWVDDQGDIFVLSREAAIVPEVHSRALTLFDKILIFTPEGQKKDEISVLDLIQRSKFSFLLPSVAHLKFDDSAELDILHTNYIEVFDGSKSHYSRIYERGNMLISMKNLNSVAIIDGKSREIVWLWGPSNVTLQHYPTLVDNGNILLFDNGTETSRVLEVNPVTGTIDWSYEAGEDFHSGFGGANQRLPNGNTLITETEKGYAFEVTPDGEVVWKFANPEVNDAGERTNIWRMKRYQNLGF